MPHKWNFWSILVFYISFIIINEPHHKNWFANDLYTFLCPISCFFFKYIRVTLSRLKWNIFTTFVIFWLYLFKIKKNHSKLLKDSMLSMIVTLNNLRHALCFPHRLHHVWHQPPISEYVILWQYISTTSTLESTTLRPSVGE